MRAVYLIFIYALCFDFKGQEEGGSIVQLSLMAATLVSAVIIITLETAPPTSRAHQQLQLALLLHLLLSVVVVLARDVDFSHYIRVVAPYVLFYLGFLVGPRLLRKYSVSAIAGHILASSLIASIFTVAYGFYATGMDASEVRFQIISPMVPVVISTALFLMVVERRLLLLGSISILMAIAIPLWGATRSYVLAAAVLVLAATVAKPYSVTIGALNQTVGRVAKAAGIILVVAVIFAITFPDEVDRLIARIFQSSYFGFDYTALTRIAEIEAQVESWTESSSNLLFGAGIGASYTFSGEALSLLLDAGIQGYYDVVVDWWFAGHNFFVYSVFTQGILGGLLHPLILISLFVGSVVGLFKTYKLSSTGEAFRLVRFCYLGFCAILLTTVGGNPLGSRGLSLYFGLAVAFFLTAQNWRRSMPISSLHEGWDFARHEQR